MRISYANGIKHNIRGEYTSQRELYRNSHLTNVVQKQIWMNSRRPYDTSLYMEWNSFTILPFQFSHFTVWALCALVALIVSIHIGLGVADFKLKKGRNYLCMRFPPHRSSDDYNWNSCKICRHSRTEGNREQILFENTRNLFRRFSSHVVHAFTPPFCTCSVHPFFSAMRDTKSLSCKIRMHSRGANGQHDQFEWEFIATNVHESGWSTERLNICRVFAANAFRRWNERSEWNKT